MPNRPLPAIHRLSIALLAALAMPAMAQQADASGQAQPGKPQANANSKSELGSVTVTGSRIKTQSEGALPVTVLTKTQIDAQGITSAEQLLSFLNVAGNSSDNLASNAGIVQDTLRGNNGVSGANLRGQGADATLVLLNGRRVATHGLKGQAVDLNAIPFAAIDRVEVLRDGASAIYGTDAIGGVINFITRRDFEGLKLTTFADVTEQGGGNIYGANILFGKGNLDEDRLNIMGAVSFKKNTALLGHERDFSNGFQASRGLSQDTRGTPYATVVNASGSVVPGSGLTDPAGGSTKMRSINIYNLPGGAGCEAIAPHTSAYDYRGWDTPSAKYACAWDYAGAAVIQQPVKSIDFIGQATYRISDRHRLRIEAMGSRVDVTKMFEPSQITATSSQYGPSTYYPVTGSSYNEVFNALAAYFGAGQLQAGKPLAYRWRCMACGPRRINTVTTAYRFLVGVEGELWGNWTYDVGLSRAASKSQSVLNGGYYYNDEVKALLGSGTLNPFLKPGQSQSQAAIDGLQHASATGVALYGGQSIVTELDANFTGDLPWHLWAGKNIALATGIDTRREEYRFNGDNRANKRYISDAPFDDSNALGNVARQVNAVYLEAYLPVFKGFDLSVAGRYDHYSGIGGTTNPKVSFKYQPIESLLFRGAYSTNYKVPSFNQLFNGVTETSYTGFDLADPATCPSGKASAAPGCSAIQPSQIFGGKTNLQPETARQRSFGVVFAPNGRFNVSLDWWEIVRMNTIRAADLKTLVQYYAVFKDNWIRDSGGKVVSIDRRYINSGGTLSRGIELDANANGNLWGGRWNVELNGSYLDTFRTKGLEVLPYSDNLVDTYVQYYNLPIKWKHTLAFGYKRGNWTHSLTQVYRSGYKDEMPPGIANGSYMPPDWHDRVESYTIYNYSASYTGIKDMKLTFGIKNLLNTDPPFTAHMNDFAAGAGWEPRIADPRGRAYMFRLEYSL